MCERGGGGDYSESPIQDSRGGGEEGGYVGWGGGGGRDEGRVWVEARWSYSKDDRNGGDREGNNRSLATMMLIFYIIIDM